MGAAWLGCHGNASLLSGQDPASSGQIKLRAAMRSLEVNGRAATLMGLEQSNGKQGLNLLVNQRFNVLLENKLPVPTAIHTGTVCIPPTIRMVFPA
jgi:hypothetical protein